MKKRMVAIAGLGLVLALAGCNGSGSGASSSATGGRRTAELVTQPVASNPAARTIAVQATGKVSGTPDTLTISIGVQSNAPTAQAALAQAADRARKVIDSLKGSGVSGNDIQTSQLSISPTFDPQGRRVVAYSASNMVTAKLHGLDHAGSVIDAAAAQGGDDIRLGSVDFSIQDTSTLVAAARADAVKQARAQAEQYAKAAGIEVGDVQTIQESVTTPVPQYRNYAAADASPTTVPTPIEPGQQELSVQISVVYAIK